MHTCYPSIFVLGQIMGGDHACRLRTGGEGACVHGEEGREGGTCIGIRLEN